MIVEFIFDSPIIRESLEAAPGMTATLEHLDGSDTIPLRNLFWASGGDFEAFETALDSDPSVAEWTRLAKTDKGRLYRVQYPPDAPDVNAYRAAVELDAIVLGARNVSGGIRVRMRFPDRSTFETFRKLGEERGQSIDVKAVYRQEVDGGDDPYDLTDAQRQTLRAAVDAGYFTIPREASLADLADHLGISGQATSERLRRGTENLVRNALGVSEDGNEDDRE